MDQKIADIRKEYTLHGLYAEEMDVSPFAQFRIWFDDALRLQVTEPNAMHLSTVDPAGLPNGRIVLLKDADERGFTFFTNYHSAKGQELGAFPFAALTFFWPEMERQVRIRGAIEKVDGSESDEYFGSRPRQSQIGAWASAQSEVIKNRETLESGQQFFEEKFRDQPVPRPPHWGGFRLVPNRVEFWQGRPGRLHDRIVYRLTPDGDSWLRERLAP